MAKANLAHWVALYVKCFSGLTVDDADEFA